MSIIGEDERESVKKRVGKPRAWVLECGGWRDVGGHEGSSENNIIMGLT
jgi:hypothetical protein